MWSATAARPSAQYQRTRLLYIPWHRTIDLRHDVVSSRPWHDFDPRSDAEIAADEMAMRLLGVREDVFDTPNEKKAWGLMGLLDDGAFRQTYMGFDRTS